MKILFELENSDLDIEFTPAFRMPGNYSDKTKVQWELSDCTDTKHLDDVLIEFRQKSPFTNQMLVWKTCDCYADTIREVLKPDQVQDGVKIENINLAKVLADRCNPKTIPINPT